MGSGADSTGRNGPRTGWLLAGVLLAVSAAYAPSLANGFTMDDRFVALGVNDAGQPNPRIHELRPLSVYLSTPYWADTREDDVLYRPLTTLTFALRHHFFGDRAWPGHLANVLLHLLATALVWRLLRGLGASPVVTGAGAAVFGLHAVHSEVVATIVGRSELLAFVLGLGAFLTWWPAGGEEGSRGWGRHWRVPAAASLLLLAFLSKESAAAWPGFFVVAVLAGRWRRSDEPIPLGEVWRILGRVALVSLPPLLVFLWLRHRMLGLLPGGTAELDVLYLVNPLVALPWDERWLTAIEVWGYGLLLVLAPFRLAADYSAEVFRVVESPATAGFLAAALALGAFGILALLRRRRWPLVFLAGAAFFGFSLLTTNLLFPIGTIFGERLYYAPSLAAALLAAWGLERISGPRRAAAALLLGLWLGASTLVIVQRNPVWRDDATLFLHEARNQPRSVRMQMSAATIHHERGELSAAANHLQRALELDAENALAWNNLAAIRLEQGRLDEAEEVARRGLIAEHVDEDEDLFKLHCNLGIVLRMQGHRAEAVPELAACLRLQPAFLRPWEELTALVSSGELAIDDLEEILETGRAGSPESPYWSLYDGLLDHRRGDWPGAVSALRETLEEIPEHGPFPRTRSRARLVLADALLRAGRRPAALRELESLAADPFATDSERETAARALEELAAEG